jgi:hypothetical protein
MITEISDAVGESGRGFGRITASEVFGAEILVASTIPQHVVDGCQDRRSLPCHRIRIVQRRRRPPGNSQIDF